MNVTMHENKSGNKGNNVTKAEEKRFQAIKDKKNAFRARERTIQDALKNLDSKPGKNKIIFDEDIDEVKKPKIRKKKDLFDNDEVADDNGAAWTENFEFKGNKNEKSMESAYAVGNDERFKLDKRFIDEDHTVDETKNTESIETSDLAKEKEWQLDILGSVLGVPVVARNRDIKTTKKAMIRYDPTAKDHREYEIPQDKLKQNGKKIKKKKKAEVITESNGTDAVEVSKDIYFSVSDSLTKSLKGEQQFSLLQAYGKEGPDEKQDTEYVATNIEPDANKKFHFSFTPKNPFKYDSSDDEKGNDERSNKRASKLSDNQNELPIGNLFGRETDRLFFNINDARFREAEKFFSKESMPSGEFKDLRRELKQIVRSKIRRNVQKGQPRGNKQRKVKNYQRY